MANSDVKSSINRNCMYQFLKFLNYIKKTVLLSSEIQSENKKLYETVTAKKDKLQNVKAL